MLIKKFLEKPDSSIRLLAISAKNPVDSEEDAGCEMALQATIEKRVRSPHVHRHESGLGWWKPGTSAIVTSHDSYKGLTHYG